MARAADAKRAPCDQVTLRSVAIDVTPNVARYLAKEDVWVKSFDGLGRAAPVVFAG